MNRIFISSGGTRFDVFINKQEQTLLIGKTQKKMTPEEQMILSGLNLELINKALEIIGKFLQAFRTF